MPVITDGHKRCAKCGERKSLSAFYIRRNATPRPELTSHYSAYCKTCTVAMSSAWMKANKEAFTARVAAYRQRPAVQQADRLRYYKYRDTRLAAAKKYYWDHRDEILERCREQRRLYKQFEALSRANEEHNDE